MSATENFRAAMRAEGLDYAGPIQAEGRLHRFKAEGDHARNSWYVLHDGTPAAGAFGCWKRGFKKTWCDRDGSLSPAEWQAVRQRWEAAEREREQSETARHAKARSMAAWIFKRSQPARPQHPYLSQKSVKIFGDLREWRGALVLPLRDAQGELHSLQFIRDDGSKRFLTGGRIAGCCFTLADKPDGALVFCEGYATGGSIHEATGLAVVCAMHAGNLKSVATSLREKFPGREIIIAADNDQFTAGNPGLTKATEAAQAIRAKLAVPQFQDVSTKPTDFNDIHRLAGLPEVARQIQSAAQPVAVDSTPDLRATPPRNVSNASMPSTDDGEEPPPKPFPLNSLPPIAECIVTEVARVERNPPVLASCAALATLSAAIGNGLELVSGPNRTTSGNLYILGTAPSGSGKSRAYELICKPFLDAQREMMTRWQKDVAPDLKAEIAVLSQRIEQLKAQARKAESDEERAHLRAELKFPLAQLDELTKKLHMPRWSTEDVTIEALADLLDQNHEVIFSMSADGRKVADNLLGRMNPNKRVDDSLYLKGFTRDGCTVDRKDKSPTILNRPCIGIFWLIQPDILDDLVAERSLMLGGFLPRALICHTRTQRQKIEGNVAPISETALADWCRLIAELLTTYHQPGVHHLIQCSEAALQRLNAHFNQTVDQGNSELADVESFVARWTEQAWHLAVVLHACLWGKAAHNHTLDLVTAEAAIAIADWFAGQQLGVLSRGRHEAHRKIEDRVLALLDDNWSRFKKDFITHRDVQRAGITDTADEARALLARMEADGVLVSEPVRRPEGGHVERRYRLKTGRNPVPD